MKLAVLADAHIGRSIPLAIAEHRRNAFSQAFTRAIDRMIEEGVDYVFFCGDLFERRTLRPHLVQFAHDELYRLASETERRHGKGVRVFIVRGNHDGRPQTDTLDYIRHPLARYLFVFDDRNVAYIDEHMQVAGIGYYDDIEKAFEIVTRRAFKDGGGMRVIMLHGFVSGYHEVPPYNSSLTMDQLASSDPKFVFAGHYHRRCSERRLPNGGWILTPGSLEMYDFAEAPEKGFYVVEDAECEPTFKWVSIEPMHLMKQSTIETKSRHPPEWYRARIIDEVIGFIAELRRAGKPGYLRLVVKGGLSEGFPGDIDLREVERMQRDEQLLLWVDADTVELELPPMAIRPDREHVDIGEFFSTLGEFATDIQEMHGRVREALEEEASAQTMMLTPSQRAPLTAEWLRRFEDKRFRGEER